MLTALPMMLMLAPAAAAPVDVGAGRAAYSKCLSTQVQPSLEQKMTLGDFQASLAAKCGAQENAFRQAILADDKASGMSDAEARQDADEQVAEYKDKIIAEYEEYSKPG